MTSSERTCSYCSHYLICKITCDGRVKESIALIRGSKSPDQAMAQTCLHFVPKDQNLLVDEMWRVVAGMRNMSEEDLRDVLFSVIEDRFRERLDSLGFAERFRAVSSSEVYMIQVVARECCGVTAHYLKEQFNKIEELKDA